MTSLVDALPEVQALAARRERVNHDREKYLRWSSAQSERHLRELDEWSVAVAEAVDAGHAPPPRPQPPDDIYHDEAVRRFAADDDAIREERQRILTDNAPEVEWQARERLDGLLAEARPLVERLTGIARQVGLLQGDVHAVRAAGAARGIATDPQHGGSRTTPFTSPTAAAVVAAVGNPRVDLLEAAPPAPLGLTGGESLHQDRKPSSNLESQPGRPAPQPQRPIRTGLSRR